MSALLDAILNTSPANNDVGVPLLSQITITLSGLNYDTTSIQEGLFVEGPDTDQYIGPGLIDLTHPNNVSQGELDDFLESPGLKGIVNGTITVSGIAGHTVITFAPERALAPLIDYTVGLTDILESDAETAVAGFVSFSFTTGSGSIEVVPDTVSTSILSATTLPDIGLSTSVPLQIVSTTPADLSVGNDPSLREIVIEFNKDIDASSVTSDAISIVADAVSDHPSLGAESPGELGKSITVDGNKIRIKI